MRATPRDLIVLCSAGIFLGGCASTTTPAPVSPAPVASRSLPTAVPAQPEGISFQLPGDPLPANTFDISQLDVPPRPSFQARPQYPFALRRAGVAGEALVDFVVDTDGNVQRAYAIRATHPGFADAAVAAVQRWRFRPGQKAGRAVNTHMQVPIVFTLNQQ